MSLSKPHTQFPIVTTISDVAVRSTLSLSATRYETC